MYGITATGEIYKLKRPEWTQWVRLKGTLKHISVGQDGTVGGIGFNGTTYTRTDADVASEVNTPSNTPVWTPLDLPPATQVVYIDIQNASKAVFIDKFGSPADALLAGSGNNLTISSSTLTVTDGTTTTVYVDGVKVSPDGTKTTVATVDSFNKLVSTSDKQGQINIGKCINLKPNEVAHIDNTAQPLPEGQTLISFKCPTGTFTKIKPHECAPKSTSGLETQLKLTSNSSGGCVGSPAPAPTTTPQTSPLQIDGKGTDCSPRIFFNPRRAGRRSGNHSGRRSQPLRLPRLLPGRVARPRLPLQPVESLDTERRQVRRRWILHGFAGKEPLHFDFRPGLRRQISGPKREADLAQPCLSASFTQRRLRRTP